ncbi:GNAT family N-acetyltransferase [Roseobacter sp.]|uniref:GNAT family N-acetyltransferase n=1 Tax=Roseobacter sp. TaxID=1907202 RepID=UPI00296652D4|nr:GNAT family N-acetyltransferase [Roseobacter sp.]MDW3180446.1 GNAT family N-acetyltransferase [Roseobacter sp.]
MTVRIAQTDDIDTCLALRRQVFIEEQGVSEAEEIDGLDGTALHLLAVDGATPVGTARILIKGDTAKIGRVCVLRTARGTGLGAQLIEAALNSVRAQSGVTRAVLGAQVQALGFYEKLGFAAFGPVYDDAGIDHRDMERIL